MIALSNIPDLLVNGSSLLLMVSFKLVLSVWMLCGAFQLVSQMFHRLFKRPKRRAR